MSPTESPSSLSRIDAAVAQFEEEWQRGQRPSIETYLAEAGADRHALLRELIHVELERRIKDDQQISADDYWDRYREFQVPDEAAELLVTEVEARKQYGDAIDKLDVLKRLAAVDADFAAVWNEEAELEDLSAEFPSYGELFRLLAGISDLDTNRRGSFESTAAFQHDPAQPPPGAVASAWSQVPGYEIIERIGGGGMGVVYKACQLHPRRLVALKLISSDLHFSHDAVERFRREAAAVASLEHEGIVRLYEFGKAGGRPFFSMQLVEGDTLAKRCREMSMQPRDVATTMRRLAEAVHYAHQRGVVHRDLKPSNVLLDAEDRPLIADFGLAKNLNEDQADLTETGMAVGTYAYMAPEQAGHGRGELSTSVDVYGLGAIMYELLTGRPPFRGESPAHTLNNVLNVDPEPPTRVAPGTSRELEAICLKCLEKRPSARYADAAELADDLQRFLDHRPLRAQPPSWATRTWKWTRRRPAVAAVVGVVVLSAAALLVTESVNQAKLAAAVARYGELNDELTQSLIYNYVQNAESYGQKGQWEQAVEALDKALKLGPADPIAIRLQKVKAYNAMYEGGDAQEEIKRLKEEVTSGEHLGEVQLWYGDLMLLEQNQDEALRQIREALANGLPPADAAYAESLLAETSPEAEQHLLRALEEDPFHYRAYAYLITLNVFQGNREEARRRAESARHLFPDDPMFPLAMGLIAAMEGDLDQANGYLKLLEGKIESGKLEILAETFELLQPVTRWVDHWDSGESGGDVFGSVSRMWLNVQKYQLQEKGAGGFIKDFFSADRGDVFASMRAPPCIGKTYSVLAGNLFGFQLVVTSNGIANRRIKALDEAVQTHPEGTLYFTKAVVCMSVGRWQKAEEAFLIAAETPAILPNIAREAEFGAAMSAAALRFKLLEEEALPRATAAVRRRIAMGPLRPLHAKYCWQIAVGAEDYELAHEIITAQLAGEPFNLVWLRRRAANELARGNLSQAIAAARQVLEVEPDDGEANKIKADAIQRAKEIAADAAEGGSESGTVP